jgi:hypothetical protein
MMRGTDWGRRQSRRGDPLDGFAVCGANILILDGPRRLKAAETGEDDWGTWQSGSPNFNPKKRGW